MKRTPLKAKKGLSRGTSSLRSTKNLSSKSPMKSKSTKGRKIDREYRQVIREMERDHVCGGCGATSLLTNSHLIARSRRPDLITAEDNIVVDCLDCHDKWESGGELAKELLDYNERMLAVKRMDRQYYDILTIRSNE